MNKIQDFLKRKGIEDKIVDYDETNEPLTPSYIIEEWEKEQLRIGSVSVMLPSYKNANTECQERIEDIKQTSSACANTDIHLGFRLGFIECYEWIKGN